MKNKIFTLLSIAFFLAFIGCQKVTGDYYNDTPSESIFKGNAWQYLNSNPGTYDSMVKIANLIPGLPDLLSSSEVTVFAIPNSCFKNALNDFNYMRRQLNMQPANGFEELNRGQLDSMISRYVIKGKYSFDNIPNTDEGEFVYDVKYNYQMNLKVLVMDASGYLKGGERKITFSDTNGSPNTNLWKSATTQSAGIATENGIVHPLSTNHDFGFSKFTLVFLKDSL